MTLHEAAIEYLVYLYALRGYSSTYYYAASALRHLLRCTGNIPLSELRERHFLMYFTLVVAEQPRASLADTRRRSKVSQSFWRWMKRNQMVK